MTEYPYILGDNAGGFPHAFLGSSRPVNVWVGRVHARLMYGRLDQSAYASTNGDSTVRFAASAIAVFTPRGLPGLELGAARFFHMPWPDHGIGGRELGKPFEGILKARLRGDLPNSRDPNESVDNQLASVFARWVLPPAGFEVYGEYGREDHSWDTRDFLLEPDHAATYGIGLRKAWMHTPNRVTVLGAETMNFQAPLLVAYRSAGRMYYHVFLRQGHTQRGQLLGADIGAASGSGTLVSLDRYSPVGRTRIFWSRVVRRDPINSSQITPAPLPTTRDPKPLDVQHALGAERSIVRGPLTLHAGAAAVYEFNRDLRADVGNLSLSFGAAWTP
jgi:hypothetical protein